MKKEKNIDNTTSYLLTYNVREDLKEKVKL